MKYSRVFIDALGYELPPVVVTSEELETRLRPLYETLRLPPGQFEALTGIVERRWWDAGFTVSQGALAAARHALAKSRVRPQEVDVVIYAGVCREQFEPATACNIASGLGVHNGAVVHDVSNACLGVLTGMIDVANRIELGQIRSGLVVSCETAREIVDTMVQRMLESPTMEVFKSSMATLTGGSGAAAVLLTDGSFGSGVRRLCGAETQTAPQFHSLCRWGVEELLPMVLRQFMSTDAVGVLQNGVNLGMKTWQSFLGKVGWMREHIDKVICHQVGSAHRANILRMLGIPEDRDFSTYEYLGNIGTVSLPLTAAMAEERGFLKRGDKVGLLGIGSGLNCMMLGVDW